MNKGTTKVNIFGQEYAIAGEDEVYLKELASAVDNEMKECYHQAPMQPAARIAVLTCLNIMDKYLKYKKKQHKEIKEILALCDALLGRLNREIDKNN
jgi:cell division protein ZapA (FtsZ GTPase activity inhibitor)